MLDCAFKSDKEREHLHLLLDNCEILDKTHKETTLEEIVRVETAYCVRSPYASVRPAYAPRTPAYALNTLL